MRRTGILLAALTALVAGPAAARGAVPPGWMGMVAGAEIAHFPDRVPVQFAAMARAGAQSVKAEFDWASIEPAHGSLNWAPTDALVAAAATNGLRLLPTVDQSPDWAGAPLRGQEGVRHPEDPAAFGRFLTALIGRYGPRGSFWAAHPELPRHPVRAWEIWNEPDIPYYWTSPWIPGYVDLLRAAHRAIKRADPGAHVVLAGLTNHSWSDLRRLYRAGARGLFDVVSLHPYTRFPRNALRTIAAVRRVMHAAGDGRTPVWVTELSWTSGKGKVTGGHHQPNFLDTTPRGQAGKLRRAYLALAAARRRYRIGRVYWYTWMTRDRSTDYPFDWSGLLAVTAGGVTRPKPALAAYVAVARRLVRPGA